MKLTITTAYETIQVDEVDDGAAAAALIVGLRNGKAEAKPKKPAAEPSTVGNRKVTKQVMEAWNWLVDHDRPEGVAVPEMTKALGITANAGASRMTSLVVLGMAHKVSRGLYRPGVDPDEQERVVTTTAGESGGTVVSAPDGPVG